MVYAILLDCDQSGGDQYAVRFSGSLAACRKQADYDAAAESWAKREYEELSSEPKSLRDGAGTIHSGRIAGFEIIARSFARVPAAVPGAAASERRRPAALVMIAIAIGGALAYHRARRSSRGRK